jgi:uncharacterized protein involved in oxidation of intracellular sulfur
MKILLILNARPGADERSYHAIRVAAQLQKDDPANRVFIYLIADGVYCALPVSGEASGIPDTGQMLAEVIARGAQVRMCTSCGASRGIAEKKLVSGAEWTNLKTLTGWIVECDKVINF